MTDQSEVLVLGGGCFWCLEAIFQAVPGVEKVVPGYAGGEAPDPSYEEVCRGTTGHAEVVQIHFDREVVSVPELLNLFWRAHDPTTRNRQGADVGTQYRSIILFSGEEQKRQALESRSAAQSDFPQPIVTEIEPLAEFYPAEGYHHDYYRNNPGAPYCAFVIQPKLAKLGMDAQP